MGFVTIKWTAARRERGGTIVGIAETPQREFADRERATGHVAFDASTRDR